MINAQTLQASAPPDGRATGSAARSQYQRELTELLRTWKPPAVDRNNFLEAENALIMDGRAARRSYAEIATVLPGHDEGSVRAQHSYLLSLVRCVLHYGGVCTLVTQQAKQQRMPPSMPPVHRRPTPPPLLADPAQLAQPITKNATVQRPIDADRVALSVPCAPPAGTTVAAAHNLQSLDGAMPWLFLVASCEQTRDHVLRAGGRQGCRGPVSRLLLFCERSNACGVLEHWARPRRVPAHRLERAHCALRHARWHGLGGALQLPRQGRPGALPRHLYIVFQAISLWCRRAWHAHWGCLATRRAYRPITRTKSCTSGVGASTAAWKT